MKNIDMGSRMDLKLKQLENWQVTYFGKTYMIRVVEDWKKTMIEMKKQLTKDRSHLTGVFTQKITQKRVREVTWVDLEGMKGSI